MLLGGEFTTVLGVAGNYIARAECGRTLDTGFNPNANNFVLSLAVQADGKILAGGQFANIGGSSPQFARVTFESSNDNVTYTSLGNGTPAGNNWTLTGLSLPIRQNIYIRARGYYRSGRYADGTIQETVRNAFISPPPTPILVVSRKIHGGTPISRCRSQVLRHRMPQRRSD